MLPMKKIDQIRSLYFDSGMKIAHIAIKLKCSANSVSKYIKTENFNPAPKRKSELSHKILPYEPDMIEILKQERNGHYKQRVTGKRIFELLKEKHPEYPCSYHLTLRHFKKVRREFYSVSRQFIPLIHNPAVAQVDFGEFFYLDNKQKLKGYILTVAFPYSNAVYCQICRDKTGESMLQSMKDIFTHIGGVPYEITFDNEPAIVSVSGKDPKVKTPSDLFLRFKNHYNFRIHFCNSYKPNEKAGVETGIKTIRMQMLSPISEITNFTEFNKRILASCDKALSRPRKGYCKTLVSNFFEDDRKNLLPLPKIEFEVATFKKRICNEMGCVSVKGKHHYYLSPRFCKKIVNMKTTCDKVYFSDEFYNPLCELPRLSHPDSATCYNWGEYFKLLFIKTAALEHCAIMDAFPETLREFLLDADKKVKRAYMRIMHEVYQNSGYNAAIDFAVEMAGECVTEYEELKLRAEIFYQSFLTIVFFKNH